MRKFEVSMHQSVSCTVTVDLDNDALREVAESLDKEVSALTLDDLRERVENDAYEDAPGSFCIHCSGMGIGDRFSMELAGDWELDDSLAVREIEGEKK